MGRLVAAITIPSQRTCFQSTPLFRSFIFLDEVHTIGYFCAAIFHHL